MAFKTKELIFIAMMAALMFVINFTIGSGIIAVTGIPGGSLFVTAITNIIAVTIISLTIKKFWTITMFYTLYGVIALPSNMAGGPPGFVWKIPCIMLTGIIFDIVVYFANYKKIGYYLVLPIDGILGQGAYMLTYYFLGMKEFAVLLKAIPYLLPVILVLGYIGLYLAFIIYDRIKDKRVMKQITS